MLVLLYETLDVEVSEEYLEFDALGLIGELGGFMGLFLGLSFYQICAKGMKGGQELKKLMV